MTTLSGTFPAAQLNKANELGLRDNLTKTQGEGMTLEDGAVLLYNALTATTAEGKVYASSLGFTVNNGVVDVSSILLSNVKGPFVAGLGTQLPFAPTAVYRNDTVTTDATLTPMTFTTTTRRPRRYGSTPARPQAASRPCLPRPMPPLLLPWQAPSTPSLPPLWRHSSPL